jgi:F-type H+-transporting ATPase subunit delta
MADIQAGRRYAQAVFDIARENGTMSQWRSDLDDVATVLAESQAAPVFADERRPVEDRQALAARILDVSPLALNLAKVLIAKAAPSTPAPLPMRSTGWPTRPRASPMPS